MTPTPFGALDSRRGRECARKLYNLKLGDILSERWDLHIPFSSDYFLHLLVQAAGFYRAILKHLKCKNLTTQIYPILQLGARQICHQSIAKA